MIEEIKNTPTGVVKQMVKELRYFDIDGRACDCDGRRYDTYGRFDIRYMSGTYECGPWELVDETADRLDR